MGMRPLAVDPRLPIAVEGKLRGDAASRWIPASAGMKVALLRDFHFRWSDDFIIQLIAGLHFFHNCP